MQVILLVELTLSAMKDFFFINTYIGFSIVEGLLVIIGLTKGSQCFARPWCNVMHERNLDVN